MEKPKEVQLTPQQEKLWGDTRAALLWHCPAFSHIFYTMLDTVNSKHIAMFTKDVPIAATDGSSVMLNPDTFFKYNLNERTFIVAHEILHCIMNHMVLIQGWSKRQKVAYSDGTTLPYNHKLMNIALDLVINDVLVESKVGQFNEDWIHNPRMGNQTESGVDVYRKLHKDAQGVTGRHFDEHMPPGASQGKDPTQAAQDRNPIEWQTAVAAAAHAARAQGKLPAGIDRLLSEVLDPKVDWREKIQALFARKVGNGAYNWRQLDRRLVVRDIIAPGRSGFACNTVVVGVDTSGSIGQSELDMFMAEMAGILEDCRPQRLFIVWCDAKVHRVDLADEPADLHTIRHKGAPGGGGTSFIPVFEWLADEGIEPDALVYLTDGLGSFPNRAPTFPVIWGSTHKDSQYPFGDVVNIPKNPRR